MASWLRRVLNRETTVRLVGQVLDENDRPVAGAEVRLKLGDRKVTTREDGSFAFEQLVPRRYLLSASKDDFNAGPTLVRVADAAESITLRMHVASTVVLRVVADRAPVVGATVKLLQLVHVDSYAVEFAMEPVKTDADGTVTMRGLAPGNYRALVTAPTPGWAQEPLSIACRDRGGTVELVATLERGARIEGTVRGPFNRPVAGAMILVWHSTMRPSHYQAESDEHGKWHVEVPAGHYRVVARSHRHRGSSHAEIDTDGRTARRDVLLRVGFPSARQALRSWLRLDRFSTRKHRRIAGVVLDENSKPVEDAHVFAVATSDGEPGRHMNAVTDTQGRFEFEAPDDDTYEVKAGWSDPRDSRQVVTQRVRPGDVNVRLVLSSGATLSGRVLLDGSPVQQFGVTLQTEKYSPFGGTPIGLRSDDGRFTLRNVDPGTWRVTILGRATRHKIIDGVTLERGQAIDLGDIVMERGDRISGHVRDQSGAPVSAARVMIGRRLNDDSSQLEQWFHGEYVTTTNESGEYEFEGVDTHSPDFATPLIVARHFSAGTSLLQELPQGDQTIDFVLFGSGRIEGVVKGGNGRSMSVLAKRPDEPEGRRRAFVWADAFRFDEVPPGDYELALELPASEQGRSERISVAEDETVKVALELRTSTVRLNVKLRGKRAADDDCHVELDPPPLDRIISSMRMGDDLHTFTFQYVKPGNYRISIDGKKTWKDVVVAASPAEQTIEFRVGS